MAERSFAREVEDLKLGAGEVFRGEGILAITKALLQSGVSYVGGYQGSPISHLMDVLADAKDVLDELGVHFETSASEATAAATLQQLGSVAFCHIDCDIRSAVEYAYDTTKPHMVPGGYWVFDDPLVADCVGAAEAVEDLLIRRDGLNSEQLYPHYVFREPFEKISPRVIPGELRR